MLSLFRPAPHKARLPKEQIDPVYRRLRWQIKSLWGFSLVTLLII
ncbi:hypothetical protein DJICPGNB_02310 [Proteus mirabilis]|nr:hypothetical protein DJICPGNB_02310 [Proteus mirabilis]